VQIRLQCAWQQYVIADVINEIQRIQKEWTLIRDSDTQFDTQLFRIFFRGKLL